jgi:hypothetical protein
MSFKRQRSPSPVPSSHSSPDTYRSESIEDQKSVFVAIFSATLSAKALQRLPDFQSATHRIAAWRKLSRQKSLFPSSKTLYDTGYDDDGEKWAGKRLEHVLEDLRVEGSVVVARWYGGINIGPIRFTHIENCAKQAIRKWVAATSTPNVKQEEMVKRQKVDEDAARAALEETLRERDQSIFVLRELLAQKATALEGSDKPMPVSPVKPTDYTKMPLGALKRLDKARDATIAFILKEIDKVEEQLKSLVDSAGSLTDEDEFGTPIEDLESQKKIEALSAPSQAEFGTPIEDIESQKRTEGAIPSIKDEFGTPIELLEGDDKIEKASISRDGSQNVPEVKVTPS